MQMLKRNKGITLVALIITIIVLLILAGVSLSFVFNGGLLDKSQQAVNEYESAIRKEQNLLDQIDKYIKNELEDITTGENTSNELQEVDVPIEWDSTKVYAIKTEDNQVIPIPRGYTVSNVDGEKNLSSGLVIYEGEEKVTNENKDEAQRNRNQYVFVPVSNINDLYDEANQAGQFWNFTSTGTTKVEYPNSIKNGIYEPGIISNLDSLQENLVEAGFSSTDTINTFKECLQNDFIEMKNSVQKYGGFYIGRYETGNSNKDEFVVVKENSDLSGTTWYKYYRLCKKLKANNNVKTYMIWNCQWDATLRWMQSSSTQFVKEYPLSGKYGNYNYNSITYLENGKTKVKNADEIKIIPSGSAEITKCNNIYDMAGNVAEHTLGVITNTWRLHRGGYYRMGNDYNSTSHYGLVPTDSNTDVGTRATLYISL